MVSNASMLAMVITFVISVFLPIVLVVALDVKKRISWRAVLVGALVFLVFQLLTRIPLLGLLSSQPWYQAMASNLVLIGLFLALTAGLFEEIGRWLGFRYLLKGRWQIKNGVAYGLGHGGLESIVLVGLAYVNNLVYATLINSGQFDAVIGSQLGPQAEAVRRQLVELPPVIFLAAGFERVLAITVQVALSLVVLLGVRQGKFSYVIYAVLLHTLLNFPLVFVSQLEQGILYSQLYLSAAAVVALVFIVRTWRKYESPGAEGESESEGLTETGRE